MSKYREIVDLLENSGVLQLDEPWAREIQELVKKNKGISSTESSHYYCSGCGDMHSGTAITNPCTKRRAHPW
jgi:hypothetical protein